MHATPTLIVALSSAIGTQAAPVEVGGTLVQPPGHRVSFEVVGAFVLDGDRVPRTDSYLDALGYLRATRE